MFFLSRAAFAASVLAFVFCWCDFSVHAQTPTPTPTPAVTRDSVIVTSDAASNATNLKQVGIDTSQTLPLTLDEAIRKALENNNTIEVAKDDVRYAETQLRSLLGVYDLTLTATPLFTRSSQNGTRPSNGFSLDLGASQLLRSGGRIEPFVNNSRSSSFFTTSANGTTTQTVSSSAAFYRSTAGVNFTQPLFRNRSIDQTRRNIRIQRKRLQQTDADFRRTTIDIISQVQRAYWDLVFALRDQQNKVANLDLSKESLRQIEAKIAAGSSAPLERAEVATELANRESDLLLASQQVSIADNTLKQLLLKDSTSPDWVKPLVPTDQPNLDLNPVSLDDALADARANRPELRRLQLQTDINTIDLQYFRNQVKPQIDFTSSFSLNGFAQNFGGTSAGAATTPLITTPSDIYLLNAINSIRPDGTTEIVNPNITVTNTSTVNSGGLNRSFANLFNSNAPNFSVGVTIGLPLRNRTAKADLAGARIQQEQIGAQIRQQEQTIIVEVRNAAQALETARQRVFTSRRARENAEIQLQGEQKLYESGRSTTFLLFQRENALATARNAEIRAETDYNKAISDLQQATSTTFRANNIEVQSPMGNQ
ncbi:MAG: TolC family protein [Pyrinomonadaceae bacterium]